MKKVCVITGGGSGMGLSTAKFLGSEYQIVLTGRTLSKLEGAKTELEALGLSIKLRACDMSKREEVRKLAAFASELGEIKALIHAAGVSPSMGKATSIFAINALGTLYVNEEFEKVMRSGSCIINIASMAAHMLPAQQLPRTLYGLSQQDPQQFVDQLEQIFSKMPQGAAEGFAYAVSKDFVIWYARRCALAYGKKGIRVLSVSPGTFDTPMGIAEGDQAASLAKQGALGRLGKPDEIASLLAFLAVGEASYLTATDILCDGGTLAALQETQRTAPAQG